MGTQLYTPSSNSIIHNTKVDFTNRLILQKTINLVQYDRGIPIIAVSLYKNGSIYSLPTGMTVKIKWGKKDRTFVYKDALGCNTERNIIFFDVDEQMTYFHGKLDPIIELVDSSGSTPTMAGSSSIPVIIERNPIQEDYIQSSNEYIDLVQAVADALKYRNEAEQIVTTGYTETDPIFTAWNKSTGISITKSQVSDLIEATQALSGLMSATDKQRLDVLHALLEEDKFSNELLATLGVKIEDLAELNKDESYTYNESYDYLLIREDNSSDSYLLDVNSGEIKSANKEAPPNPNVDWEQTSFSGKNTYVVDVKYNAGGNYRVVPRVERMFLSEPPRVRSSLGVGELISNNPGKYLVAINAGKYNLSNPNYPTSGPEGVLIIDGVIYEEIAHPNYRAIAFNDRGEVKFFQGVNATDILNEGYTSATTGFHPVILNGNKMGKGYINSPGGALTNAMRQVIVGLKNGDYKVYSFQGGVTFEVSRDIIYDNEPDVDFAYQLDGGGSLTTYVDDELVYAAERSGSGRRVLDAIVWELKEFVANDIIDLDGNKITYIGNSKLEITGVLSIPERERQEMKRDLNDVVNDVVNLSGTQAIPGSKTFSSPVTFGYNAGHMLEFESSGGTVFMRTSSGKLMLKNGMMSSYSPIATEGYVDDKNTIKEQNKNTYIKFWTGTQAEYDAIGAKDANTLYFIEEG